MGETAELLAIVNPAAGGGRCGKRAPAALADLEAAGIRLAVKETRAAGDATRIAREAYALGRREFVVVGGDGTAHEVVNGLFPEALTGGRLRLGFLPLGTGNSFLRDFSSEGLPFAKRALIGGAIRGSDVMRIRHAQGDVYSLNLASIGFVADVCVLANRAFKPFGAAGYALGVVGQLARLESRAFPFRVDGGPLWNERASFISFNNSKFTGGTMMMAPAADVLDGKLEVVFAGALSRLELLRTFPKIFSGAHVHHPAVRTVQAARVDFEIPNAVDVMVDGEVLTVQLRSIEVLPNALDVRA